MKLFTIDFISGGGWYTYDVTATDAFDAACELFNCCGLVQISSIQECML